MTAPTPAPSESDPDWFREPTAREHRIAGWLFLGFGVFFLMLFVVLWGWWFRWVIGGLGIYSFGHGVRHLLDARRRK
ncbi:MAG TPA: hypothetical protein VER17_08785 [Tepidisphaeraceae bacterium]|nr:hypothetical protein [Tepidisphaeraceae bacterium]